MAPNSDLWCFMNKNNSSNIALWSTMVSIAIAMHSWS